MPAGPLPITEQENPRTKDLSSAAVPEILRLMNDEDALVAPAVTEVLPQIAQAVDGIVTRLRIDGRLFYIGTGTSGRLGVLDASECPPTFGVEPELVQGIIAGGYEACYRAVEASEDDAAAAEKDLEARDFSERDVLVGIAASGSTPYTVGALAYARQRGALTIALTCAPDSEITRVAELSIVPIVGPEVLTGSTRLKAGTAQKLVLNMLSTATLTRLGYVSGNRMSNLRTRNAKLRARAIRIVMSETGSGEADATRVLDDSDGDVSVALVVAGTGCDVASARKALAASKGVVRLAVDSLAS